MKHTLKTKKVAILDNKLLKCLTCGVTWLLPEKVNDRLPQGFWHCPNKCNFKAKTFKHSPELRNYFKMRNRKQRLKSKDKS